MLKNLNFLKRKNFGLSLYITNFITKKSFGVLASKSHPFSNSKYGVGFFLEDFVNFYEIKATRAINLTTLSNPIYFGLGLKRYLSKRIKVLKFNRSYRGIRHSQSLPVRYQRSKTNARTQKSHRRH